jgi:Zn-dependent protease
VFAVEPQPTNYDLNFSLFGIPVRIHPLFFLLPVLWGSSSGDAFVVLVYVLVFFVSILVHELGHVLAMMSLGQRARILLYSMGGLAIPEGYGARRARHSTLNEILISAAGPAAGFLLAVVCIGICKALGAAILFPKAFGMIPIPFVFISPDQVANPYVAELLEIAVTVNVVMNLFNLIPIIPLDGGQIMREVLIKFDPWNGMTRALWVSIVLAGLLAMYGFQIRNLFLGLLSIHLAISNYQTLQMQGPGGFRSGRRPW